MQIKTFRLFDYEQKNDLKKMLNLSLIVYLHV